MFSFLFQAELINEVCTNYTRDDSCDQDGAEHLDCLTLEDVEAGLKSLRPLKSRYVGRAFLTLISFTSFSYLKDLLLMCFVSHMFVFTSVRFSFCLPFRWCKPGEDELADGRLKLLEAKKERIGKTIT